MNYLILSFYLLTCLLYRAVLKNIEKLVEKIYQNATSKNRNEIKKIKESIVTRRKIYVSLFWPLYEAYKGMFPDEWRCSSFRILNT